MSYASSSYITLFSLVLGLNIDLVCSWDYSSLTLGHRQDEGARGARLVILCMNMVPWARGIYRTWLHPMVCQGMR